MKTYFRNYDELAKSWVNDDTRIARRTAKGRMFTQGDDIYSYGTHFVIGNKWTAPDTGKQWFLLTERTYSPTTSKQVRAVRCAVPSDRAVYLPQVDRLSNLTPPEAARLVPNYRLDLTKPDATEQDLASVLALHEFSKLDAYGTAYLRKRKPWSLEILTGTFDAAEASIKRFGRELPAIFHLLREQCVAKHYHLLSRAEKKSLSDIG